MLIKEGKEEGWKGRENKGNYERRKEERLIKKESTDNCKPI